MIRIIVRTEDANMAANLGGAVHTSFRTFDVWHDVLEDFLREPNAKKLEYVRREVIGVLLIGKQGDGA